VKPLAEAVGRSQNHLESYLIHLDAGDKQVPTSVRDCRYGIDVTEIAAVCITGQIAKTGSEVEGQQQSCSCEAVTPTRSCIAVVEVDSLKRFSQLEKRARNKQRESATSAQRQLKISSESMKHYAPGVRYKPAFKTVK